MFGGRSSLSLTIEGIGQSDYLNYLQISFSFALGQLVTGAVAPFSGMLADRYGTGKTLILGVLMTIMGCLLIPLSSEPNNSFNFARNNFFNRYWYSRTASRFSFRQ